MMVHHDHAQGSPEWLEAREKEAAQAFRWLEARGVAFIEFANGDGLDVGNTPGGLLYAILLARQGETHA